MLKKILSLGLAAAVLLAVPVFRNLYTPRYETRQQRYSRGYEYYHKGKYKKAANALTQAVELDTSHAESRALLRAVYRATDDMENYKAVLTQAAADGFDETEIKLLDWLLSEGVVTPSSVYEISINRITYYDEYGNKTRVENYGNLDRVPVDVSKYNPEHDANLFTRLSLPYVENYERWVYDAEGKLVKCSRYSIGSGLTVDNSFIYNELGQIAESHLKYPKTNSSTDRYYIYNTDEKNTLNKVEIYSDSKLSEIYYYADSVIAEQDSASLSYSINSLSIPNAYYKAEIYRYDSDTGNIYLSSVDLYTDAVWLYEGEFYMQRKRERTDYFNPDGSLKEYIIYEYYTTDNVPPGKKDRISRYADPGEKIEEENRYSADGSLISYRLTYYGTYGTDTEARLRIEDHTADGEFIYGWVN